MKAKKPVQKPIKQKKQLAIQPDIMIAELIEMYPQVIDVLVLEYEFHCVGCVMAGFETLSEGAEAHGIVGKEFKTMLKRLNELVD